MLSAVLFTVLSFVLLFVGAELLVRGGAGMALRLGLTALVVGLTVVAYGTSSPELLVSLKAAMVGQPGIAVGNVIGSNIFNIFNILFVLGLAAVVHPIEGAGIRPVDQVFTLASAAVLVPVMFTGRKIGRAEGILLFAIYAAYLLVMWPR